MNTGTPLLRSSHAEAEQAVCVLCANFPDLVPLVDTLDPRHFAIPRWRAVWGAIVELHDRGELIDGLTVADRVPAVEPAELVAGIGRFSELAIEQYASIVRDAHVARQVALSCSETLEAMKAGLSGPELLELATGRITAIDVDRPDGAMTIGEMVMAHARLMQQQLRDKAAGKGTSGIPTGFRGLDVRTGGLHRGVVTVVAARPGMGKSAFAMSICEAAATAGYGVHVMSLEDTRDAYSARAISRASKVAVSNIRALNFNHGELDEVKLSLDRYRATAQWLVDDTNGLDVGEVCRRIRRHAKRNNTSLAIIDYINLIKMPPFMKRHEAIGEVMREFTTLAKSLDISVVVLAQLNRGCEARDDKRPLLSDLKDSGDIEEKAKCVLMLYRPRVYDEEADPRLVEILIRKNNQGSTETVEAKFDAETIRMY